MASNLDIFSILDIARENQAVGKSNKAIYDEMLRLVRRYGVKMSYHMEKGDLVRVIITPNKLEYNSYVDKNPYGCVIVDCADWSIVAVGPNIVNPNVSEPAKNYNISQYKVYQIIDGSVIILYHWRNGTYLLGTTNGHDVTNMKWMGEITWGQIFKELASKYKDLYESLTFETVDGNIVIKSETLNPNLCYAFNLTHHSSQPFKKLTEGLVHLQTFDLSTCQVVDSPFVDVPIQKMYTVQDLEQICDMSYDKITVNSLLTICNKQLDYFIEDPHYGFLLRDQVGGIDLLLESRLLKRIRELLYDRIEKEIFMLLDINERMDFKVFRVFINENNRRDFILLFPEYKEKFVEFDKFFDSLVNAIINQASTSTAIGKFANEIVSEYLIPYCNLIKYSKDNETEIRSCLFKKDNVYTLFRGFQNCK